MTRTDVEPPKSFTTVGHPAIEEEVHDWKGWFWVAPKSLEHDPFFEDLLKKHADELKEIREDLDYCAVNRKLMCYQNMM